MQLPIRTPMRVLNLAGLLFVCSACSNDIWNASDLIRWVRKEAVKSGCEPESVRPAEWYVSRNGQNVWPVDCVSARTGQPTKLEIGIDKVWKPSQ